MNFNEIKKCNDGHKICIGTDWGLNNDSMDALRYYSYDWNSTIDAYDKYCLGLWEKKNL